MIPSDKKPVPRKGPVKSQNVRYYSAAPSRET